MATLDKRRQLRTQVKKESLTRALLVKNSYKGALRTEVKNL